MIRYQAEKTVSKTIENNTNKSGTIKEWLICSFMLLTFFIPEGINMPGIGIEWIIRAVGIILIGILATFSLRYISRATAFYFLFYLSLLISTLLNGRELIAPVSFFAQMVGFILIVNYYAKNGKLLFLLKVMKTILGLSIIITLLFQIFDKDHFGYTEAHNIINFLTSDNFLGYWYIPFILIVYLSGVKKSRKYQICSMCFWATVCLVSLVYSWAATCLSVFVIFLVLFLFRNKKIFRLLSPVRSLVINAAISFSVIVLQIQKYFDWLIVDILQKDLTLSGRVNIWASAIMNISQKPFFGYGVDMDGRLNINRVYVGTHTRYNFSHNVFLEVLIQGGIIAMIFLVLLYISAQREIQKTKRSSVLSSAIYISVFSLLLMQFSEFALHIPIVNFPLILCFYYKDLLREGLAQDTADTADISHEKGET